MIDAIHQCGAGGHLRKLNNGTLNGTMDEDWHTALNRSGLERKVNCHNVSDIENQFHTHASCKSQSLKQSPTLPITIIAVGLCVFGSLGWYNLSISGWLDFDQYQQDIDTLAPSVS